MFSQYVNQLVVCVQAWLLDQFGVLHDGKKPYPGAISTCMFSYERFGIWVSFSIANIIIR